MAVLQDLQHTPVVSIQYFKDALLPKLPTINIAPTEDDYTAIAESNPDNPDAEGDARKYFLMVLQAEDVMIDDKTDNMLWLFHDRKVPDDCPWWDVHPEKDPSCRPHLPSTRHIPSAPLWEEMRVCRRIYHKIHFRMVFAELGTPIFNLTSLGDVLKTLEHALKGLQFMHWAGWVHRDVSAGNVLRCGSQGKIVDLESAKVLNSTDESHDVRTGTANFMACEVKGQQYLFFKPKSISVDGPRPFHYNPLHDLESWWWILNWVLHFHVDSDSQTLPPDHDATYQMYFPGFALPPGATRSGVLHTQMSAAIFPPPFHTTVRWLEGMRMTLVECYEEAEQSLPAEYQEPSAKLCQYMLESIQGAREAVKPVTLKPSHHLWEHQAQDDSLPPAKRRKEE